jgi:NADPH:quinone reductase-like Zn-dependent oxidoreductase
VIATAADRNHALLRELGADRTRIASITGSPRRATTGIQLLGYGPGQDAGTELRAAARAQLVERAGSGALRVVVDSTFPLAEAAKAHEIGLAAHAPGKLVLLP